MNLPLYRAVSRIPGLATAGNEATREAALVCLCYVGEARSAQIRYNVRRIRRQFPTAQILVSLWRLPLGAPEVLTVKESSGADFHAATLREAVSLCREQAEGSGASEASQTTGNSQQ
jgi:hypothetical protein